MGLVTFDTVMSFLAGATNYVENYLSEMEDAERGRDAMDVDEGNTTDGKKAQDMLQKLQGVTALTTWVGRVAFTT